MNRFFTVVVLSPWLALSAWSQTPPAPPLSQVQLFLGLTDSQVSAILQNEQRLQHIFLSATEENE
jgi:hypothetical protein